MDQVVYSRAESEGEIEEAFSLVYQEYKKSDYINCSEAEFKSKIPFSYFLSSSATFLAKINDIIAGTISLVVDSDRGLPMDEVYREELDKLRGQNKKIAEVCRLATSSDFLLEKRNSGTSINNLSLLLSLFKLVLHHAVGQKIDNLCIAINPKHNSFYSALGFEDIGGLKYYSSVNDAPALAKTLDLSKVKEQKNRSSLIDEILKES